MRIAELIDYRPPRIALSFVLTALALHALLPLQLHPALPVAAAITAAVGFGLMIRAWWLFRLAGTAICPTETSTALITGDVFSISRNPMYLGMILMLFGLALAIGAAPFYLAAIAFSVVMDVVFCPYEERKALLEFGASYDTYRQNVRRWL
jgi:protein-S-isoprenylcysteine O-methyltransferase Ste14